MNSFNDLGLDAPILKALSNEGYSVPTPIQAKAIPQVLAGRDLLGIAQTGTGKTAAFALPIIQLLQTNKRRAPRGGARVLVLSPTRELASQIAQSFKTYGRHAGISVAAVFGGVGYGGQSQALAQGLDVLVATPGRLLDHLNQRTARLGEVEIMVLDEADQMLDMGFIQAIRRIIPLLPKQRQNLFFSATMPKEISALAGELLKEPVNVTVTPVASTVDRVDQRVILIDAARKRHLLAEVLSDPAVERALVFTRTKHGADRAARYLDEAKIGAAVIHGNKSQSQRERALGAFRAGRIRILVATDIAARGIDVDAVSHVINFDLPNVSESYVHRIGRTARAGATGIAISFCDHTERQYLRDIERLIRQSIPSTDRRDPQAAAAAAAERPAERSGERPRQGKGPRGRGPGKGVRRDERRHDARGDSAQRHEGHRHEGHRPEGNRPQPARREGVQGEQRQGGHEIDRLDFMAPARRREGGRPRHHAQQPQRRVAGQHR